ncbi:MAG: methylmalonyl-CoA mutase [Actinomycetia bacterium]|nr:methylmalonyl-CoA mutase [Actinomycetes bacterium]MCP4224997.1 methylmalonyl-CoA mutase [Actinomycetes bacterium]MCP5034625.1 methylmalonyl-CoA mutase [Actinomycetes bacterium]
MSTDTNTDPIRILLAKPTHDCHDRGVRLVAKKMRQAGFEVIFSNFLLPEEVVNAVLDEDVDVVGISASSGGHLGIFEELLGGLKEAGRTDTLVIGGGVIPPDDEATILGWGVSAIFGPGTNAEQAIEMVRTELGRVD